jgi:hypothetical protein
MGKNRKLRIKKTLSAISILYKLWEIVDLLIQLLFMIDINLVSAITLLIKAYFMFKKWRSLSTEDKKKNTKNTSNSDNHKK